MKRAILLLLIKLLIKITLWFRLAAVWTNTRRQVLWVKWIMGHNMPDADKIRMLNEIPD